MKIITRTKFDILFIYCGLFTSLLLQPCFLMAQGSENKQARLEIAIHDIIKGYSEKDAEKLKQYLHPTNGIYFLLNENNSNYWLKRQSVCLAQDCISNYNFPILYKQKLLEQGLYLDFVIEYRTPDLQKDEGLFVDDENIHALTSVMRNYRQKNNLEVNHAEMRKVWRLESNSKRVVLLKSDYGFWEGNFTFYLSYLNNNWYLSIIDFNN